MEILLLLDVNSSTFWKWHALNFNGKMLAFHCFKFLPVLPSYPYQQFEIKFCFYFWIKTVFSLPCLKITKWLQNWLGRKTERQGANVFLIHAFFFHGSVSKQHPLFPNKTIHWFCSYVWISFRLKHNWTQSLPHNTFSLVKTKGWQRKYRWRREMKQPWQGQVSLSSKKYLMYKQMRQKPMQGESKRIE